MYDILSAIVDHTWTTGTSEQQYIMYTCAAMIPLLTVVFIDTIKGLFARFWRH